MREHLEKLAAHLEGLDSESGDAKAIRWALDEIDRLASLAESLADDLHAEIVNNPDRSI